ncbi:hypothetical protein Bca4012_010029 [Brassica carinata]
MEKSKKSLLSTVHGVIQEYWKRFVRRCCASSSSISDHPSCFHWVVSQDGTDIDDLPSVGTKWSVKERLGNQLDVSAYGSDAVSKRQRGEASFGGNDFADQSK